MNEMTEDATMIRIVGVLRMMFQVPIGVQKSDRMRTWYDCVYVRSVSHPMFGNNVVTCVHPSDEPSANTHRMQQH